jgi:hypothetical protein
MEAQLNLSRKETEDSTSRCAAEAKKLVEDVQIEAHNLDVLEREAAEILKVWPFDSPISSNSKVEDFGIAGKYLKTWWQKDFL